jgi:hypothetical protein
LLELNEFSCHAIEALATTYDLLHAELGEARRRAVLRVLHRGLDYYRERMKANDWWYADNPSNTIGVAAGCHGIGALALLKQRPKDVEEALALAERAWSQPRAWLGPGFLAAILLLELLSVLAHGGAQTSAAEIGPKEVGRSLFGPYVLGVELASLILLSGLVGAYHLARRFRSRDEEESD